MSDTHAQQSVSYVRKEMLAEQTPPAAEKGAAKWMRENLFSSWLNIILTVISLYVVYVVLSVLLPWAFGGVWNAGSLTECREVLFAFYKGSHDGACWAVIEDRWLQLLFGFYPPEEYWRPILAFLLFFVALAPILFADKVSSKLMWFSLAYPFLATWLIWGGSVWMPIFAALGFVVGYIAYKIVSGLTGPIVANLAALAAALIWWGVAMTPISDSLDRIIGSTRIDSTVAELTERLDALPAEIAALEAAEEAKAEEVAQAVAQKDQILADMILIRDEEVAIEAQAEAKETALQRLGAAEENLESLADALIAGDTEEAESLIADVSGNIQDSIADLENTVEPDMLATTIVAGAIAEDPTIAEDISGMVSKAALSDPLVALADQAASLSGASSAEDIASLEEGLNAATVALEENVGVLTTIMDKTIASNADELAGPQSELLTVMSDLTVLRNEASMLSQDLFRATTELSDGRGFFSSIQSLEEREATLPERFAIVEEIRAELPRAQRGMVSVGQLGEGASTDEQAALAAYIEERNSALALQSSIQTTYGELGRVGLRPVDSREIGGFMLAIIIGVAGIVMSLPLGILLALGRQSHLFIINKVCVTFIEVIRGVPLIVWLFTASILLNYFLPPGTNFDLMLRVIIMVTLFASAYIAEVVRGGLAALPTGQYEGADSLGLGYWQSMQLIVLPQALKISIPGIVNTFIGLFKDSTLVVFIGLLDPIGLSNAIRADTDWNGVYWELFVFIGLLFFIFCFSMGRYSLFLEKKLQREHR